MANISHFTQTVNGISTTYDIHDANAIPRSGGAVIDGTFLGRTVDNSKLDICGASTNNGAYITLYGKNYGNAFYAGSVYILASDGSNICNMLLKPDGTASWNNKNLAMQEDTVPRSGGAVMSGSIFCTSNKSEFLIGAGTGSGDGAYVQVNGMGNANSGIIRMVPLGFNQTVIYNEMLLYPNGTWTWTGTACQIVSDQRLKQQIDQIDDKLLDAWEDVDLVQFKYNDAVDQKGKSARLHTGYVVQQIQKACESHGVDISQYGLFCHEEYPEETEEIEVESKDGTKTKERKVIREANEHYSLRYTEALIVECKYLRRCIERLEARLAQFENPEESQEKGGAE